MLIHKLRLQRGWSQQQLAEMSGLSTRTIQRIENGGKPSVESIKSLAAVFEIDFLTLQEELNMDTRVDTAVTDQTDEIKIDNLRIEETEAQALQQVRKVKKFYSELLEFAVVISVLALINLALSPQYWWVLWVILGWGISILLDAIDAFEWLPMFNANWEKKQLKKYLKKRDNDNQ